MRYDSHLFLNGRGTSLTSLTLDWLGAGWQAAQNVLRGSVYAESVGTSPWSLLILLGVCTAKVVV